jgi:hypothetical protein
MPIVCEDEQEQELSAIQIDQCEENGMAVATRLTRYGLNDEKKRTFLYEANGVKYFAPDKGRFGGVDSGSLPLARVATVEIKNCSIKDVEDLWFDQGMRSSYDSTVTKCRVVQKFDDSHALCHFHGQSGWILPARDYAVHIWKTAGGAAGLRDISSSVVVMANSPNFPSDWRSVRGKHNSLLLLQPIGPHVRCSYLSEIDYAGWIWSSVANLFADKIIDPLANIKLYIESQNVDDNEGTIEEVATRRIEKMKQLQRKKEMDSTLVDDVMLDKKDLQDTINMLQKRLNDVRAMERAQNLDMSELKGKIQVQLRKANDRLKIF